MDHKVICENGAFWRVYPNGERVRITRTAKLSSFNASMGKREADDSPDNREDENA